jgi:hypothetical protein
VARWLLPALVPVGVLGLALMGARAAPARWALAAVGAVAGLGAAGLLWPARLRLPPPLAVAGYALAVCLAGCHAWLKALRREQVLAWEPTRRASPPELAPSGVPGVRVTG